MEFVSGKDDNPLYEMENKTCLKHQPVTQLGLTTFVQNNG
jgi:hypothetical protein